MKIRPIAPNPPKALPWTFPLLVQGMKDDGVVLLAISCSGPSRVKKGDLFTGVVLTAGSMDLDEGDLLTFDVGDFRPWGGTVELSND